MLKTKRFRRLLTVLLAVLMLSVGIPVAAFAADAGANQIELNFWEGSVNDGISAGDSVTIEVTATGDMTVKELLEYANVELPNGYTEVINGSKRLEGIQNFKVVDVELAKPVEPTPSEKNVTVYIYCPEDGSSTTANATLTVSAENKVSYAEIKEKVALPSGCEWDDASNFPEMALNPDNSIQVWVKKVAEQTATITINYVCDGQQVGTGSYTGTNSNGYVYFKYSDLTAPEGYTIAENGDTSCAVDSALDVRVTKNVKDVIMKVRFVTQNGGTYVSGGDYFLPEGVQNYSILEQYVPEGYKMAESGDFMVVEGGSIDVFVNPESEQIIVHLTFKDRYGNVQAAGDYFVPYGIQNYSVLSDLEYVPLGYTLGVTGDVEFVAGNSYDIVLDEGTSIVNIQFKDANGNVIGGGDYFVPTGIHNRNVLDKYVPEGYRQTVTGDIQFVYGQHYDITVEPIPAAVSAKTAIFRKDNAEDVWNENPDNPDEVSYKFWSDSPEATCVVPSLTLADETKVLDHWVSDLDETVVLYPGEEFCYNDLDQGALKGQNGDFAFYPVYADAPVDPDQPTTPPTEGGETTTPPTEGGDTTTDNNSGNNNTTTVTSNSNDKKDSGEEVVKSTAAPADNTAKVLPQTGVQTSAPITAFVVVLAAALAGAACYLFVVRKKLN